MADDYQTYTKEFALNRAEKITLVTRAVALMLNGNPDESWSFAIVAREGDDGPPGVFANIVDTEELAAMLRRAADTLER